MDSGKIEECHEWDAICPGQKPRTGDMTHQHGLENCADGNFYQAETHDGTWTLFALSIKNYWDVKKTTWWQRSTLWTSMGMICQLLVGPLVVWNMLFFHSVGNNHANCLLFFRGIETTNQIWMLVGLWMKHEDHWEVTSESWWTFHQPLDASQNQFFSDW